MARPLKCSREEVLAAVKKGRGKPTHIASILDVDPETLRNYAKRWKTVANAIETERLNFDDALADKAEIKLEEAVVNGKAWAIKYALDRKGGARGYVPMQRQEITGADSGPLTFRVVYDDENA